MADQLDPETALRSAAEAIARLAGLDLDVEELERTAARRDKRRHQRRVLETIPDDLVARGADALRLVQSADRMPPHRHGLEEFVRRAADQLLAPYLAAFETMRRTDEYRALKGALGAPPVQPVTDAELTNVGMAQALEAVQPVPAPAMPDDTEQRTIAALLIWADRLADDGYADPRTSGLDGDRRGFMRIVEREEDDQPE